MAYPGQRPPVTFEPTHGQRGERLVVGLLCVAAGIGMLVFSGSADKGAVAIIVTGLCLAALGVLMLATRRGHTTIDADGVHTASAFGRHACRWSEVTDVELKIDATDGDPITRQIKIHRRGGGSFTLSAPTDSSRKNRHDNPDFQQQLATINSYWAGAAQPRQP